MEVVLAAGEDADGFAFVASLIGLGSTALITAGESEIRAAQLLSAFFVVFLLARIVLGVMAHRVPSFAIYTAAMFWAALSALVALPLGATVAVASFPGRRAIVVVLNALLGLPGQSR